MQQTVNLLQYKTSDQLGIYLKPFPKAILKRYVLSWMGVAVQHHWIKKIYDWRII